MPIKANTKKMPLWLILILIVSGLVLIPVILCVIVALAPFILVYLVTMAICDLKAEKHEKELKLKYKLELKNGFY